MSHVSKVSFLRVRQVESGKKWINFYKQGVEDLRFEQRDFNCLEGCLFLESQFVRERDWVGENKNDLSHAFSTETFGLLVETKAIAYYFACYTVDFTGSFFTPTGFFNRFYRLAAFKRSTTG